MVNNIGTTDELGHFRQQYRLAYGLIPLLNLLRERGVDGERFLAHCGIPSFGLVDPTYTITLEREMAVLEAALPYLPEPHAGLLLARHYHLHNFSVLGLALKSCSTIAEFLPLVTRFPNLLWGVCETRMHREGDRVINRFIAGSRRLDRVLLERDMACGIVMMEEALARPLSVHAVRLACPEPEVPGVYESFFGCPVSFNAPACEIEMDATVMALPLPTADPLAKAFYEAQCERMAEELKTPFSYRNAVRERLLFNTPVPKLADVAQLLNATPRSLQRRLGEEGCRFSDLLYEVRRQRAEEMLAETGLRIEEIADMLAFQDAVAFSHAFKKWTGLSPRHWRERQHRKQRS